MLEAAVALNKPKSRSGSSTGRERGNHLRLILAQSQFLVPIFAILLKKMKSLRRQKTPPRDLALFLKSNVPSAF
jgi:hypothetical protein